jgi:hypothetical protein
MIQNRLSTNLKILNKYSPAEMEYIDLILIHLLQKPQSGVWVYDRDMLVDGSPFPKITQACKAVGIGPSLYYLDNNKLVNKRIALYSYTNCKNN